MMKNTTSKNAHVIEQLNEHYYFINFNAEENRSINFNGASFSYKPTGNNTGVNQLAIEQNLELVISQKSFTTS